MSDVLDKIINTLKWPVAFCAAWIVPAVYQSFDYFNFRNYYFLALVGGFFTYFVGSMTLDSGAKTSMQIIAHELTHSFFAILTLHSVKHIRVAEDNSGGSMGFVGKGNWLIVIAPYFFPLFCFIYMIGVSIYLRVMPANWMMSLFFGYFVGYYVDTVISQIHDKQTDLKEVGYPFCCAFLPGANMWVFGSLLAFNSKSWAGFVAYQDLLWQLSKANFAYLLNLLY